MTWAAINPILKHSCVASAYVVGKNDVVSFILESGSVWQEAHDVRGMRETKPGEEITYSGCLIHNHCDTLCLLSGMRAKSHTLFTLLFLSLSFFPTKLIHSS